MNLLISYPSFYFTDKTQDVGGESRVAWEIVSRLAKRGIACFVVGPEISMSKIYERIVTYQIKGCSYRYAKNVHLKRFRALKFNILSKRLIKRLLREHKIDIIHHIRPSYPGFFSSVSDLDVPFIYGGITVKYDRTIENTNYKENRLYRILKLKRWYKTLRNANKILLDVNAARNQVPRDLWDKVEVLQKGVDTEIFKNKYPPKNKVKIVLYLTTVRKNKGSDILLKAVSIIVKRYPNVLFLFVGRIIDKPYFENIVNELDIAKWVSFKGQVSHEETVDYYHNADIFCLPSLQDSSPNVVLEAMASSLPVVATNVMGIPEYIEDGKSGILVEPGDIKGLSEAILRLLENEDLCMTLSKNACRRINEHFSWDRNIDRLIKIYQEVLSSVNRQ